MLVAAMTFALAGTSSRPAAAVVATNWSGYAVTGSDASPVSFSSVSGAWRAPAVGCPAGSAGASVVVWVGIGGYGDADREVAQVGTSATCRRAGRPTSHAWFEIAPNRAFPIERRVWPGDAISASVDVLPTEVVLRIENRTRKWAFARRITWALADTFSAEWIVEAPTNCLRESCALARLANFGTITMTGISATGNSLAGTLANPAWTIVPIRLVRPRATPLSLRAGGADRQPGAFPGPISADGTGFDVSWVAVPRG